MKYADFGYFDAEATDKDIYELMLMQIKHQIIPIFGNVIPENIKWNIDRPTTKNKDFGCLSWSVDSFV